MMKTYSRRLLSPYIGVLQVVEIPDARALSLDGRNWEVQHARLTEEKFRAHYPKADPDGRFALVATIESGRLKMKRGQSQTAPEVVQAAANQLHAATLNASLPFDAVDVHECWLLDQSNDAPLALLGSCADLNDGGLTRAPSWVAMPAAQLPVPSTDDSTTFYVPPVNYRLEQAVNDRAGARPRAKWIRRAAGDSGLGTLPPCLLREDWPDAEQRQLCERYLHRLAPRLLMLADLSSADRQRLEVAACDHVFDVERFHAVYPEVLNDRLLTAARVEARLRRHHSDGGIESRV
ncbi:MAG: hypothetical protein N838_08125 [Thiohalocapsa sp. PB-PSB1]|jgi:hypothetical protein|nr:MAG: hypothetical protein N838_27400 [Thiohalocapsa sp. PB-PSB1]QQO57727.1 MAG: hypothetical protein N838_08125 [Thiohalocapsa sp. PB-PSB1]HCS92417.1 hypothetical protein [Chromatiaceae bacterium]